MADPMTNGMGRIVRERYENPQRHGDAHFRINPADWTALESAMPAAKPRPAWSPGGVYNGGDIYGGSIDSLLAIPVVLDEDVPVGRWRLVGTYPDDDGNHEIREEGALGG